MWGIHLCFLFLFCYTNGQLKRAENQQAKVKDDVPAEGIIALKEKRVETAPSQWERDGDIGGSRWPNGVVRYYVDPSSYDSNIIGYLDTAFSRLSNLEVCPEFLHLKEKPKNGSWLHFTNPHRIRDCLHDVGQEGEIVVVLGYDCLKPSQILHTIMHGLGFHDEITHPKRDLFVRVLWDNIQPAFRSMFGVHETKTAAVMGYDPKSIMHCHDRAYSVNGQATVLSLHPGLAIEPSDELSQLDKIKIRLMFNHECKERQINKIFHPCKDDTSNNGESEKFTVPGRDVPVDGGSTNNDVHASDGKGDGEYADVMAIPGSDIESESDPEEDLTVQPDNDQNGAKGDGSDNNEQVNPDKDDGDLNSGSDNVVISDSNLNIEDKDVDVNDSEMNYDEKEQREVITGDDVRLESGAGENNADNEVDDDEKEQGTVVTGNDVKLESGAAEAADNWRPVFLETAKRRRGMRRRHSRFYKYEPR